LISLFKHSAIVILIESKPTYKKTRYKQAHLYLTIANNIY